VTQDSAFKRGTGPGVTSHTFDKDCSCAGQAADLLAWHVRKGNANQAAGNPVRKDTLALIEDRSIKTIHYERARLMLIRDDFIRKSGSLERAARILFNPDGPLYHGA
jgi:hypothetical protein